jgi:DNA ligase (NAD+)
LAKRFGSIEKIKNLSLDNLEDTRDIGPIVAKSAYNWFHDKHNLKFLDSLFAKGITIEKEEKTGTKLKNKTFVLTGTLMSMSREEAKQRIQALGGDVLSAVSKNLDYLLVGENPGSKFDKAKELGVLIIDEAEFLRIIK